MDLELMSFLGHVYFIDYDIKIQFAYKLETLITKLYVCPYLYRWSGYDVPNTSCLIRPETYRSFFIGFDEVYLVVLEG